MTWSAARSGASKVFAQRIDANGQPVWAVDGFPSCTGGGWQTNPAIVSDASGGAVVAWADTRDNQLDVYAQRIDAAGNLLWPPDGAPLCRAPQSQTGVALATDGSGGGIAAWVDVRDGNYDVYANRASGNGAVTAATEVLDVRGRVVRALRSEGTRGLGRHVLRWDGRDDSGTVVASGVYFVRVRAGTSTAMQRVIELR